MKKFHSKVDWWVWLLIIPAIVVPISTAPKNDTIYMYCAILLIADIIIALLIVFPTCYKFDETHLEIKCGICTHMRIPCGEIESFGGSKSWEAAPALSLDRIRIKFKTPQKCFGFMPRDSVLVSPKLKAEFTKELSARIEKFKKL